VTSCSTVKGFALHLTFPAAIIRATPRFLEALESNAHGAEAVDRSSDAGPADKLGSEASQLDWLRSRSTHDNILSSPVCSDIPRSSDSSKTWVRKTAGRYSRREARRNDRPLAPTGGIMFATDDPEQHWTIRSTLVAVTDLDRAVDFYRELGPFDEVAREGAVSVLGRASPSSVALILRETKGTRHGPQSLGVRSINFSVGTTEELDRIESVLRDRNLFTQRKKLADDESEFVSGRDPDNLPLLFVSYGTFDQLSMDYFHMIADLTYSLDT
jgi:hypothetical protein